MNLITEWWEGRKRRKAWMRRYGTVTPVNRHDQKMLKDMAEDQMKNPRRKRWQPDDADLCAEWKQRIEP